MLSSRVVRSVDLSTPQRLKSTGLMDKNSCARTTHILEALMLIQEKISGEDSLLNLYVAIDEDPKAL